MENKYQEALDYINGEAIQEITNSYFRKHKTLDGISFEEFDKNLTKIQELVDKHEKIKKTLNKVISACINETGKVLERDEISYIQALQFVLKLLDWSKDE